MGTQHMAQVEVALDRGDGNGKAWQAVSRWELQKDYGFARAMYKRSIRYWPGDADVILGEEETESIEFDGKRWIEGAAIAELSPVDEVEWFEWARELQAHVVRLLQKPYLVRVLWWEV